MFRAVRRFGVRRGHEKRDSRFPGCPVMCSSLSNPHPQTVQVLGSDTHKIPILAVLNAGRLPFAAREYLHALAAMQPAVVVCNIKTNVVAVGTAALNENVIVDIVLDDLSVNFYCALSCRFLSLPLRRLCRFVLTLAIRQGI